MSNLIDQASLVMIPSGYKEDKIYSQVPTDGSGDLTFSRASDGTRVNSQGLVERVPWNLLQQSNSFSTTWVLANATLTSGQSGYDGSSNAWLLAKTGDYGRVEQSTTTSGLLTLSVYAKAGTLDWLSFENSGIAADTCFFDLANGVVGSKGAGVVSTSIESIGGGWHRCSAVFNGTIGTTRIQPSISDGVVNGTNGNIYIQDAQLVEGSTAKPYFPTTDRQNVPRLDYSGGCPSLLLEPQRTNLYPSSLVKTPEWNISGTATITTNFGTSPDGTTNSTKLTATSGSDFVYDSIAVTSGVVYTNSFYIKNTDSTRTNFWITAGVTGGYINWNGATIDTTNADGYESVGNGWYRVWASGTTTSTSFISRFYPSDTGSGLGVEVYGFQHEQGTYPTSLIPTTSASVTRVADAAYKTGISSLIGQSEGTIFVEFDQSLIGQSATRRIFALSDGTTNNRITAYINSGNKIDFYVRNSGGDLFLGTASTAGNTKGVHKIAAVYKDQDYAVYFDGSSIISGTGTAGTIPACSRFDLANQLGANDLYEPINQAVLFKTRLTNAELAALTTL